MPSFNEVEVRTDGFIWWLFTFIIMEKEFVTYEQALALKELGFDEDVLAWYDTENKLLHTGCLWQLFKNDDDFVLAPLKQQVFKWFREKYNILHALVVPIKITASDKEGYRYSWEIIDEQEEWIVDNSPLGYYSYEEAENACIDKLIEIAKK
jgi:hypothetical protein